MLNKIGRPENSLLGRSAKQKVTLITYEELFIQKGRVPIYALTFSAERWIIVIIRSRYKNTYMESGAFGGALLL